MRFFTAEPDQVSWRRWRTILLFVGLIGMINPPRPEVREAVAQCKMAGIRPIMITGDHPLTAKQIAVELDIAQPDDEMITGQQLAEMSQAELEEVVMRVPVFARVSPEHKLNIVQALQSRGQVVAMTGDGVNDAPALRKAEIGVAVGVTGTDVSKEAADMVILDDNFATIVRAVEEGRTIYDNVRKFMQYIMTSNAGEIYVMLLAHFLGMPLPLIPLQILWVNLVTDGPPGLALSVEASEKDTMHRPPFSPDESIFSRGIGARILWIGLLVAVLSLGVGYWGFRQSPENLDWWRTLVFNTLTISQMFNALGLRLQSRILVQHRRLLQQGDDRRGCANLCAAISGYLLALPPRYLQNGGTLSLEHLLLTVGLSSVVLWALEVEKWFKRRTV